MNISSQDKIVTLKSRHQINNVLKRGFKISTQFGPIFFPKGKKNDDSKVCKIAILLSKKVGNAVHRNYVKRIFKEYIRKHPATFKKYGRAVLIYNFKGSVNFHAMEKELNGKLKRI
ncbi:MAG: ribonuclease P protein component [Caldithrix sp.]|nr:ribonuclease P protein component [Caldithrix sp.]